MTTKTLTITEEAYERLAMRKEKQESFSEVIVRFFPKHSLLELVGAFPREEVVKLRRRIAENRERSMERSKRIAARLK